jgi:tetratricopeptide (TPR) repeat protein
MLAFACVLGGLAPIRGENPLTQATEIEAVEAHLAGPALVEQLASAEFTQRRQAFLQLWQAGKASLPLISTAKDSTQRPIAEAAKVLEILIDLEIAPERLAESARLLDGISDPKPQSILELCTLKYWNVAERMLAVNPELVRRFQDAFGRYMLSRVVDAALEQEQPALAWPIIRLVVSPSQAAWMSYKTGLELQQPTPYITAQRLFYEGKIEEALQAKAPYVAQLPMLTRTGRWERMADDWIVALLAGRQDTPSQLAAQAVLHEVAGDGAASTVLWSKALQLPQNPPQEPAPPQPTPTQQDIDDPRPPATDNASQDMEGLVKLIESIDQGVFGAQANKNQLLAAMFFSGRVAPIAAYLRKHNPEAAFGFFLAGNQQAEALQAIGLQADLSNFDEWFAARKALITEQLNQRTLDDRDFDQCARLCAVLADLGFQPQAQLLLDELVELAQLSRGKQTELWSGSLLPWLGRSETRQLALRAAQREFPQLSAECQAAVLKGLFPEFEDAAAALWATSPSTEDASKWNDLQRLYVFDQAHFGANYLAVVESWLQRAVKQLNSEQLSSEQLSSEHLLAIAKIANGFGNSDLAIEVLLMDLSPGYGQSASANIHWTEAARIFIERGKPESALPLLSAVRRTGINPQHAYAEEVQALVLSGQFDRARTREQARWLRPLATSVRSQGYGYFQAAREFVELHQFERAAEVAEVAYQLAELGSIDLYWSASVYGDILEELDQPIRRADVLRSAWVEALQPFSSSMHTMLGDGYFSALRYSAQKEKLARAIANVHQQQWQTFEETVQVARLLQPQDIEIVCQCYPLLQQHGQSELAEQLFAQYEQEMRSQIERWPNDATALNNLAWMYSQCDQKLEEARRLSQQAVSLAPSSAVFLDTLAEVHFRAGDLTSAQNTMRECIRLDPRERHYRENLIRFRKSAASASPSQN